MKIVMKLILSLILLGLTLFCVFGFVATFEPLERNVQTTWRIIYAVLGLACLAGQMLVWRTKRVG